MTVLDQEITQVNREVDLLVAGDKTRIAIEEIESAHNDLDAAFNALAAGLRQRNAIINGNKDIRFEDVAEQESQLVQLMSESHERALVAWDEDRARIRQSGKIGELVQAMERYSREVTNNNKRKWTNWSDSESRSIAISDTELESIRNVPKYASLINTYREGRQKFRDGVQRVPSNSEEVIQLAALARKLSTIKSSFTFDLPKFVLKFFDALDSDGSVQLAQLSDELMAWLKANDELKNLSVVRYGMRRY